MRCAQRGCALPPDTDTSEGAHCPTCNNPLIVVREEGDEVSQEQPPVGEDGALLAVAVDFEEPPTGDTEGLPPDNGVNTNTGN